MKIGKTLRWLLFCIALILFLIALWYLCRFDSTPSPQDLPEIRPLGEIKKIKPANSDRPEEKLIYRTLRNAKIKLALAPEEPISIADVRHNIKCDDDPFMVLHQSSDVNTSQGLDVLADGLTITYLRHTSPFSLPNKHSNYYMQLGASRTRVGAEILWQQLLHAYPRLLKQYIPKIIKYYSPERQKTFYLLLLSSDSFEQAKSLCHKLNNNGHHYCSINIGRNN